MTMPLPPRAVGVPSPCISVCRMQATAGQALCEGCYRTIDEIARWGNMSEMEKKATWKLLNDRKINGLPK
jgi:uncharacterized protein